MASPFTKAKVHLTDTGDIVDEANAGRQVAPQSVTMLITSNWKTNHSIGRYRHSLPWSWNPSRGKRKRRRSSSRSRCAWLLSVEMSSPVLEDNTRPKDGELPHRICVGDATTAILVGCNNSLTDVVDESFAVCTLRDSLPSHHTPALPHHSSCSPATMLCGTRSACLVASISS